MSSLQKLKLSDVDQVDQSTGDKLKINTKALTNPVEGLVNPHVTDEGRGSSYEQPIGSIPRDIGLRSRTTITGRGWAYPHRPI